MFYSGHKKGHGLNFMGVVMTNGLLPFMSYAALGKDHDSRALTESGFNQKMRDLDRVTLRQAPPKKYVVYADPAFPLGPHVQKGFQGILTPMQAQFNKQCNSNRVSVEWGSGYVLTCFAWNAYPKAHQVLMSPVNDHWHAACILSNFKVCFEGNQVSAYFDCDPPGFDEYAAL